MGTLSRRLMISASVAGLALWSVVALAAPENFQVQLAAEPSVQSSGTGTADLTYDPDTKVLTWSITYSGLSSDATMAHFHGKDGKPVLWISTKGTPPSSPITGMATLTSTQAKHFLAGDWYINVHTKTNPKGEIRGQVTPPKS